MSGFELCASSVGSDRSANCTTTTAQWPWYIFTHGKKQFEPTNLPLIIVSYVDFSDLNWSWEVQT